MTTSMIMDLRSRFEVLQPSDEEESGYVAPQVEAETTWTAAYIPASLETLNLGRQTSSRCSLPQSLRRCRVGVVERRRGQT